MQSSRYSNLKLTAELSLYPLQDNYLDVINAFIETAHEYDEITIVTNAMSTQVCGDYDRVLSLVGRGLKSSYEKFGRQVLVCKLIPGELAIQ
jgi:uncharacterized protein YqgV (UPF0045/DUF77 family)